MSTRAKTPEKIGKRIKEQINQCPFEIIYAFWLGANIRGEPHSERKQSTPHPLGLCKPCS